MPTKVSEYELYKRIKLLGEGSFGKAYLVECLHDKSTWVIKYMDLTAMSSQEKDETLREAKILEYLRHPNIVQFKEVYKTKKGKLCIVMEFADGGDLTKKVKDQGGKYFSEVQILDWFTQLCLAIKHVHDRKIIHRDLKCQNIFLTKDNRIKLGDFGIARILKKTMEKAKTMVGTPYYISPEIIQGKQYSLMTDIWSLGVVLYELCTLNPPFNAESIHYLALKIVKGQYTPIPNNYSKELKNLVTSLLQVDPRKRPTIQEILKMPVITNRIKGFLTESVRNVEFSHTILHQQAFEYKGNLNNINLIEKEQPCPENLIAKQMKDLQPEFPVIDNNKQAKLMQRQPSNHQLPQATPQQQKPGTAPKLEPKVPQQKQDPTKPVQKDIYKQDYPLNKNLIQQKNEVPSKVQQQKNDTPYQRIQGVKQEQQKSEPSKEIVQKNDHFKFDQINNQRQVVSRNEPSRQQPNQNPQQKVAIHKPSSIHHAEQVGYKNKVEQERVILTPQLKPQSSPLIAKKPPQNPQKDQHISNAEPKNLKPPIISGLKNNQILRSNESNVSQQNDQQSNIEQKRPPSAKLVQQQPERRPQSSKPNQDVQFQRQEKQKILVQKQRPASEYRNENHEEQNQQRKDQRIKNLKLKEEEKNKNKRVEIEKKKLDLCKVEVEKRMQEQQKALDQLIQEKEAKRSEDRRKLELLSEQQQLAKQQEQKQQEIFSQNEYQRKQEEKKRQEQLEQEQADLKYKQSEREKEKEMKKSNPDLNRQKMEVANKEFEQMLSELNGILEGLNSKVDQLPSKQQNKNYFELESKILDPKIEALIEDRDDDDSELEEEKNKENKSKENFSKKPRQLTKEEENGLLVLQDGKNETLKVCLTDQLGEEKFNKAYKILKQKLEELDFDQFEAKFGSKYSTLLPFLNQTQIRDCVPLIITYIVTHKEY